jgi:hypothetical protein
MTEYLEKRRTRNSSRAISKGFVKIGKNGLSVISFNLLLASSVSAATTSAPIQGAWVLISALIPVILFYILLALSLRSFYAISKREKSPSFWLWLHPAVVTAGEFGEASISSLQLLWFTLIVLFIAFKGLIAGWLLSPLSADVLSLLGFPAASKIVSVVISNSRLRLSLDNWNWLINNQFLRKSNTIDPRETAGWKDLILMDGVFDPVRFQLIVFSFLVGFAMLRGGSLNFDIGQWSTLLAGSNFVYLGGKAVSPTSIKDLDVLLNDIRGRKIGRGEASNEEKESIGNAIESAFGRKALGSVFS